VFRGVIEIRTSSGNVYYCWALVKNLTILLHVNTYSIEQSPSSEANRLSVKKFPAFYGSRSFITAVTIALYVYTL